MKQLLLYFLFINQFANANDFSHVDALVKKYPGYSMVDQLAKRIRTDFKTDSERARAAFTWLAHNIRYDLKSYYNPRSKSVRYKFTTEEDRLRKVQAIKDRFVMNAFRYKKGVCEEYAQAFKKLCDLMGIEAAVVKGNTKTSISEIGKPSRSTDHAWNAVKVNGSWQMIDATWAAGFEQNKKWIKKFDDYFFNIPANRLFKSHFPAEPVWVLRFGRITKKEYYNQPLFGKVFLKSAMELEKPSSGILKRNTNNQVTIYLKNALPDKEIFYVFKGQKYLAKPKLQLNGNITTVTIPNASGNSHLFLYFGNECGIEFRVI